MIRVSLAVAAIYLIYIYPLHIYLKDLVIYTFYLHLLSLVCYTIYIINVFLLKKTTVRIYHILKYFIHN
jgi:hypothetical protein